MFAGVLFVVVVLLAVIIAIVEYRHSNPILPLYVLKNPVGDIVVMNMLAYVLQNSISYLQPLILSFYGFST